VRRARNDESTSPSPEIHHTVRHPLVTLAQWVILGSVVGVFAGAASAVFLLLLDDATGFRGRNELIVYALPIAGLAIGSFYARYGSTIRAGNDLVIDTIHDDGPEIPLRMTPMVLVGTVLTHLFGGSAGREGTAVQMGASLSDFVAHRLRVSREVRRQLLAAGVAGGFGSVFGTPIAGVVFGLEFVALGRIEIRALVPALFASIVGDMTTRALGVGHTHYPAAPFVALDPLLLAKWLVFGAAVAIVSVLFVELTRLIKRHAEARFPSLAWRMFAGGIAVVLMWKIVGTTDYLGLGIPMIERAFVDPDFPVEAFALKLIFTAVTLGAGFLGGEVTPLFFVGAALGSVLARALDVPLPLGAGVGMAAVFAASSNAPLALSVMAVELLGANAFPHVVIVATVAYVLSGHRGIYPAQRLIYAKDGRLLAQIRSLKSHSSDDRGPPS
jgi:H+/Cl- antiporter ClcA